MAKYPYNKQEFFDCYNLDTRTGAKTNIQRLRYRQDFGTLSGYSGAYLPAYPPRQNGLSISRLGSDLMIAIERVPYKFGDTYYHVVKQGTAGYLGVPQGSSPPYVTPVFQEDVNRAFLSRIRENANFGVSWAERQQTAAMLSKTVLRVVSTARMIRKGRFLDAAKHLGLRGEELNRFKSMKGVGLKALSDHWLEYQYGWKPLLSDIHSGVEFLHRRRGNVVDPLIEVLKETRSASYHAFEKSGSVSGTTKVQVKVWYKVSSPTTRDLMSFGITNPLLTAWELVPFSFVVDWFYGVGDYLQELDATAGLTFLRGFQSQQTTTESFRWTIPNTTRPFMRDRSWTMNYARAALSTWPSGASAPTFKDPRKWSSLASSIALCATTFGRKAL